MFKISIFEQISKMDIKCKEIQQNLYESLGDREYDCFKTSEEKYLKIKIGYTLFGPPKNDQANVNFYDEYTAEQCYDQKQNKTISDFLKVIKSCSKYSDPDQIIVSFMYNCLIEIEDMEIYCFPIFRVKKCFGSPTGNDCCRYIDENLRVYQNWTCYLENNKLPKGIMFVPRDGKYKGDFTNNKVLLDVLFSPACSLKEYLKKVGDVTTTAASFISGGIAIASLIPAITVAPMVLAGALITGAGVGVYSVARSSIVLHDRRIHKQSISLSNEQARNCYLNIVAGATSVVTTGATKAASLALNKGVIISETAATALLSVNAVNMAVNGCNAANSLYKIIKDIKHNKKPSTMDIMHLTTSFLFFGNAVVNLKSATVIYNESQTKPFSELIKSRSQELWNRAKETFFKTDVTTHENNSSLKIINDSGDFCQSLVTASIQERGGNTFQKVVIDMLENIIFKIDFNDILMFGQHLIQNKDNAFALCKIILARFETKVQQVLIKLVEYLIRDILKDAFEPLKKLFPSTEKVVIFFNFIINYLKFKVSELEIEYQTKKAKTLRTHGISEDDYDNSMFKNAGERMSYFFSITALKMICANGAPEEIFCREMVRFFWDWLAEKYLLNNFNAQNGVKSSPNNRRKNKCRECNGYYYS